MYVIVRTTNLVCVLFDPAIPTLSFNFIVFLYLSLFVNDIAYCPIIIICMIERGHMRVNVYSHTHARGTRTYDV